MNRDYKDINAKETTKKIEQERDRVISFIHDEFDKDPRLNEAYVVCVLSKQGDKFTFSARPSLERVPLEFMNFNTEQYIVRKGVEGAELINSIAPVEYALKLISSNKFAKDETERVIRDKNNHDSSKGKFIEDILIRDTYEYAKIKLSKQEKVKANG